MSERYLQSLAILLAGLFSAERLRSKGFSLGLPSPSAEPEPTDEESARAKAKER